MFSLTQIANSAKHLLMQCPMLTHRVPMVCCLLVLLCMGNLGCGYTMGTSHPQQYRTVAIPIAKSNSARRGIEEQLTEAVQRELQQQTHLRLAKEPYADTRLMITIVDTRKRVLGETLYDDPRELQLSLAAEVRWEDTRTGQILYRDSIPVANHGSQFISHTEFAPEVGHSLATATQNMVDGLARQIVENMENPW